MQTDTVAAPGFQAPRIVVLPAGAYSAEAIHRAAYVLMASIDVRILSIEPGITCELHQLQGGHDLDAAELMFRRELTDQQLRITIEQRTDHYRDLILGLAFSRTGLQDG